MPRKAILIVALLMFVSGFLFGTQQSGTPGSGSGAPTEPGSQAPPDTDRPRGVNPSSWVPLGETCGVIVRQKTSVTDDFFEGRLTCKFGSNWYPVYLAAPPPTITPSE
jgi:hypothetical protein